MTSVAGSIDTEALRSYATPQEWADAITTRTGKRCPVNDIPNVFFDAEDTMPERVKQRFSLPPTHPKLPESQLAQHLAVALGRIES